MAVVAEVAANHKPMSTDSDTTPPPSVVAGVACANLIADPKSWINRRVETVEMLSQEETRRRVSIDFTLDAGIQADLETGEGIVVPIAVLEKKPRRAFDLRDESGCAIPALGKAHNGELAHIALMSVALDAMPVTPSPDAFAALAADLRQVVFGSESTALTALEFLAGSAKAGDPMRKAMWEDDACRLLLSTLAVNYVLFAVLAPDGASRRILKYSYAEDFDLRRDGESITSRLVPGERLRAMWRPDRRRFLIELPAAWRAASFHAEVAIPAELRARRAFLFDLELDDAVSDTETDVSRVSLYASEEIDPDSHVVAYVEAGPERSGQATQGAVTCGLIAALLWAGVASGLDAQNPDAAVSLLLAGIALFSGLSFVGGEHHLTRRVYRAPRRWLLLATLAALVGSTTLAMEIPSAHPVKVWRIAAVVATVAFVRLAWSAFRGPR